MAEFDLSDALLSASFSLKQRFQGFRNTAELKDTITGMFDGVEIQIDYIQGRSDNFEAKLFCDVKTEEEIKQLLHKFEANTKVTVKSYAIK